MLEKKFKKQEILLLFSVGIFCFIIGIYIGESLPNPLEAVLEPGSMVTEASYVIFQDSGIVYARDGNTGEIVNSDTDAATVINWAIEQLTNGRNWKEKVVLKGNFTLTASILIDSYTVLDLYQARLTLANNVNDAIIKQKVDPLYEAEIRGGFLDGNKDQQSSGHGIEIDNTVGDAKWIIKIVDTDIRHINDDIIHIDGSSGQRVWLENVYTGDSFDRALYLRSVADSWIINSRFASYDEQVYLDITTDMKFIGCYIGGTSSGASTDSAVYIRYGRRVYFEGCTIDHFGKHGVRIVNSYSNPSQKVHFINSYITNTDKQQTNDTYTGIRIEGDTVDTLIQNSYIGKKNPTINDVLKYGIEERDNADYTTIIGVNARQVGTAGIVLSGSHSHANLSWNGTSWLS